MMNIALVPARCGSKSIPMKNIKPICGKPLIYWVLKALQDASAVDRIYVATDCDEIASAVESFSLEKVSVYRRLAENARDESSTESVMLEFFDRVHIDPTDTVFLAQATTPLLRSIDIDQAFSQYKQEQADSLLTCVRAKRFFWNDEGTPVNYDYRARPRRQDFKGVLMENGALYISEVAKVIAAQNRLNGKIAIYEMPEYGLVDIDEEDDWPIAERFMKKYITNERID